MRLKSIKLVGFKSFVDSTSVHFPSNLCAVVGPNGCGKSNIIDAVRWVMGESSAKNLRGESMTDVIFNGALNRQPVGQASIELLFDNADGTLGGEYAGFSEIAVRRVVTREAISQYYLNGTKCRRRDVTDIFLGTGLGPRSYAIIEQGTISKLIEAKPEELRVFIEEAAGISKYKERRRETESRMRRTAENMERLTDIRDELERQLQHLKRQASAAEKYGEFKQEERTVKAQLQAIQWRDLDCQLSEKQGRTSRLEVDFETVVAEHRAVDADLEQYRATHIEQSDDFSAVQSEFYSIGAEVARIEQSIQHQKEREEQLQNDLKQTEQASEQARKHLQEDRGKVEEWTRELTTISPQLNELQHKEGTSGAALEAAETAMHEWQQEWDAFNQSAAEPRQVAEVQQSKIQQIEQVLERVQQRITRAETERNALVADSDEKECLELEERIAEVELNAARKQGSSSELLTQIKRHREDEQSASERLDGNRAKVQEFRGRHASLEALQQAALGRNDDSVNNWLGAANLQDNPRLGEIISADSEWQLAVETVLGDYLQAVCVEGVDALQTVLGSFEQGRLVLMETAASQTARGGQPVPARLPQALMEVVTGSDHLAPLLSGVFRAESLADALESRGQLLHHESLITREGIWVGPNWLRVSRNQNEDAGVIERQAELDELGLKLASSQEQVSAAQSMLEILRTELDALEEKRESSQLELQQLAGEQAELQTDLTAKRIKIEQVLADRNRIGKELEENRTQFSNYEIDLSEARGSLQIAIESMERDVDKRELLLSSRDTVRAHLDQVRQEARHDKDAAHQLAMRRQSLKTQMDSIGQGVERTLEQLEQLQSRRANITESLGESGTPLAQMKSELATLLEQRLEVEKRLTEARQAVSALEHKMREAESSRGAIEQRTDTVRSDLERHRLDAQGLSVRRTTIHDQLKASNWDLEDVLGGLEDDAEENAWLLQVERVAARISRLGPINLAAIDEYKTQSERKNYLDAQNADLERALETLANAIRKIDRETRSRFKDTFDQISAGIQELFPKVFGGGTAYLEMTGEDLLDTGVAIMARPPGKKNSTIHLLSGGEKALTAIALVFSIFRLNPAPFCMLDEVDAPLDDANVARYARMVREMSEHVQFIYITHNKISMEMADQLVGVTMHEPGVSRLVTVDVEEAAEMAAL
ncbi:MAG: chromosome segregation protein [Halieaceae bacterium]|jgi:chromosome segregation protein